MQEATPRVTVSYRPNPIIIGWAIVIVLAIIIASFFWFKSYRKYARIKELLPEFVQVSDDFTRPKFFVHKAFHEKAPSEKPKYFVHRLGAYTDGRVRLPYMPTVKNGETGEYDVIINLEDKIFTLHYYDYQKDHISVLSELNAWVSEAGEIATIKLRCRVKRHGVNTAVVEGDFTLTGEELDGFLKTIELSNLYLDTSK